MRRRQVLARAGLVALVAFALLQLVPYGWAHPNPPVVAEPPWPDARAATLARAACADCHSNRTRWPAYAYVAPVSWLVRRDVEAGRDELNRSRWDRDDGEADDAARAVADGSMPPARYTLLHPGARLSHEEREHLVAAFGALEDRR